MCGKKNENLLTNHKIYLVYYLFLFSSIAHSIGSFDWGTENLEIAWGGMTMPCHATMFNPPCKVYVKVLFHKY